MLWNSLCISFLSVFNLAACSWSKRNITFQVSTLSNYLKLHHWECRMVCRVGVGFSIPVQWHELVCGSPGQCKDHLSDLYRHESWTIKKAECWRLDALKLWCWRRPLRVLWTARRSNQSILKEISPGCSLEGLMLKLKLQHFGHLMQRADSLEKTLMLGKIEGKRRRGRQRMRWLDGITDLGDMNLSRLREMAEDRGAGAAVHGSQCWTWLSNWTKAVDTQKRGLPSWFSW